MLSPVAAYDVAHLHAPAVLVVGVLVLGGTHRPEVDGGHQWPGYAEAFVVRDMIGGRVRPS